MSPVVIIQQGTCLYVCVPLVEVEVCDHKEYTDNLELIPSVTIGLCMLKELARVVAATEVCE